MRFFLTQRSNYYFFYNSFTISMKLKQHFLKSYSINFFLDIIRSFKSFFFFNRKWIFFRFINFNFLNFFLLKKLKFDCDYLYMRVFKAHGINMRLASIKKKTKVNLLFLRLGFSHGLLLRLPKTFLFRVFKRRYFLISSIDSFFLDNLVFQLRNFRSFFSYKLIGLKLYRDVFKLKIGKKKSF